MVVLKGDQQSHYNSPTIANMILAVTVVAHTPGVVLCMFCNLQATTTYIHPMQKVDCILLSVSLQI